MPFWQAKKICPGIIKWPSNPIKYAKISTSIMNYIEKHFSPDIEVVSIDEAFIDLSKCLFMQKKIKEFIFTMQQELLLNFSLPLSMGISNSKIIAKCAAKSVKPQGIKIIPPSKTKKFLQYLPVTEIPGISRGISQFLAKYHIYYCGEINKIPVSVLGNKFGGLGIRIWFACNGFDPCPVKVADYKTKSMGNSKILPPNILSKEIILEYFFYISNRLANSLRENVLSSNIFMVRMQTINNNIFQQQKTLLVATNDNTI